jgi:hypothetical protein
VNVADVELPETRRDAGTVIAVLPDESATVAPSVGAACDRVTVQMAETLEASELGEQAREAKVATGATRDRAADLVVPFRVAVTLAVWFEATDPAVAVKVAELQPSATATEAGAARVALSPVRPTIEPPVGAACDRVTVQMAEALEASELGEQANAATLAVDPEEPADIDPPVADTGMESADADAPNALIIPMFVSVTLGDNVNWADAITPFGITLPFKPATRQVKVPAPAAQLTVFPASVRADAPVTVTAEMLADG